MTSTAPQLDHLVIAAPSLQAGVQWCEQTLGITPGPGGEHALMGTHNRLALIGSAVFPNAYLEIIAINPKATPTKTAAQARWFGFDDPALRERLLETGPQLIHWVARVADLPKVLTRCEKNGIDLGASVQASRMTAQGLLSWSIAIRNDGQLQFGGVMPTLIAWGPTHPAHSMPATALKLTRFICRHPAAAQLNSLWESLGGLACFEEGVAGLSAQFDSPRGLVQLKG